MKEAIIKRIVPLALAALSFAFVLLCFELSAAAQTAGVGVSPVVVEETAAAGAARAIKFKVTNNTRHAQRVRVSAKDVWYADGKRVEAEPGTQPRSATGWVRFYPAVLVVAPSGTGTVEAVVTVPPNVSGSFYTMPVFDISRAEDAPSKGSTAAFLYRLQGRIVLTTPDSSPALSVVGVKVEPPTATTPLSLKLELANTGDAHIVPSPTFALLDGRGQLVARGKLTSGKLMPGEHATASGTWAGELPQGRYSVVSSVSFKAADSDKTVIKEITFAVP